MNRYKKSLYNLSLQYANYQNVTHRAALSVLDQEGIAESCIQRFEICYDCLWKTLKRHLMEVMGLPEIPNSPKPVFRLAHENKLLQSPIGVWLSYADTRTETAHDYDQNKAEKCLAQLAEFLQDASQLYCVMTSEADPCSLR